MSGPCGIMKSEEDWKEEILYEEIYEKYEGKYEDLVQEFVRIILENNIKL